MKLVLAIATASLLALSSVAKPDEAGARGRRPSEATQLHIKGSTLFGSGGMAMGPGLGMEFPLFKYLSLGGQFNSFLFFEGTTQAILDFDVFAKGIYRMHIKGYDAAAYLNVPLGLSLAKRSSVNLYFNFGILPGFEFYFNRHWGIFAELGLKLHIAKDTLVNGEFGLGLSYAF